MRNACPLGGIEERCLRFYHLLIGRRDQQNTPHSRKGCGERLGTRQIAVRDLNGRECRERTRMRSVLDERPDRALMPYEFANHCGSGDAAPGCHQLCCVRHGVFTPSSPAGPFAVAEISAIRFMNATAPLPMPPCSSSGFTMASPMRFPIATAPARTT